MHTVIKGTKTVEEFKKVKETMEQLATESYKNHKSAFENWTYGEVKKVWFDADNNLCIEYESGDWFHYNGKGEWW